MLMSTLSTFHAGRAGLDDTCTLELAQCIDDHRTGNTHLIHLAKLICEANLLFYGIGNSTAYPSSRSESRKVNLRSKFTFLWYRKFHRLSEFAKRISQSWDPHYCRRYGMKNLNSPYM